VTFDTDGHGRQPDLDGGVFDYPASAFTTGRLGGVPVRCLSRDQQLRFHQEYRPRPADLHDVNLLEHISATQPGQTM
jgi:lincosamide nucleotidyltransferase A/C/D/E